jgi:hypothetical protein
VTEDAPFLNHAVSASSFQRKPQWTTVRQPTVPERS